MNTNVQPNSQPNDLITYYLNGDVQINLDCILTPNHIVSPPSMILAKVEGQHTDIIKLLRVRNTKDMVYLQIKDLKTKHVHEISQRLDSYENLFIWWVTSYKFVAAAIENRVIRELKGTEIEFDF